MFLQMARKCCFINLAMVVFGLCAGRSLLSREMFFFTAILLAKAVSGTTEDAAAERQRSKTLLSLSRYKQKYFYQAVEIYGFEMFTRPMTLFIIVFTIFCIYSTSMNTLSSLITS